MTICPPFFMSAARLESADCLFVPTDWPHAEGAEALEVASAMLGRRAQGEGEGDFEAQRDRSFHTLVEALSELKTEGVFAEGVYLTVLSTDPLAITWSPWRGRRCATFTPASWCGGVMRPAPVGRERRKHLAGHPVISKAGGAP